jgi:tetratricopeptide (TPR) repeat protein
MKKFVVVLSIILPALAFGQEKAIKPSIPKADAALRANKLDEAKAIIDATTSNQEFMVDKKGNPSKNAAKAWYIRGLIYAAMDTTKKTEFHTLVPSPFAVAKESFDKAKALDPTAISYVNGPNGLPLLIKDVNVYFAQRYYERAVTEFQEKKNYKRGFELAEQTLYFIPEDTSVLMNTGVYFATAAEEFDKSIAMIEDYLKRGGKNSDAFLQLISLYRDKKKDYEKALAITREAITKLPNNSDLPKYELDLLVKLNRLPDAKTNMEKQIAADPSNPQHRYYLGVINTELKDKAGAKAAYEEALKLDPKYFDAQVGLAEIVYSDATEVKKQMNQLGITAEDKKKRFELDKVYVEKLKVAQPYWEAAEKLSPDDAKVLDNLLAIYSDLDNQPQVARVTKRMKALGLLD